MKTINDVINFVGQTSDNDYIRDIADLLKLFYSKKEVLQFTTALDYGYNGYYNSCNDTAEKHVRKESMSKILDIKQFIMNDVKPCDAMFNGYFESVILYSKNDTVIAMDDHYKTYKLIFDYYYDGCTYYYIYWKYKYL